MTHSSFLDDLLTRCRRTEPVPTAVVYPMSEVALSGAVKAAEQGLILPHLVGPAKEIASLASQLQLDIHRFLIEDAADDRIAAERGVALCRAGTCLALMKGSLHTDDFLRPVMRSDTGLRTRRRISHAFVLEADSLARPLLISDAAINIYPTLEDKAHIVQNAIDLAHTLGILTPRVAILSALETVTPKITATIDAAALCKMADRGQITGGILDGPLAFDDAMDEEAASIKQIDSPVAGHADILIVPDLESGNMLVKQLEIFGRAQAAGVVLGASVPIILTSRANHARERLLSTTVAVLLAQNTSSLRS